MKSEMDAEGDMDFHNDAEIGEDADLITMPPPPTHLPLSSASGPSASAFDLDKVIWQRHPHWYRARNFQL